jgi:hypothetical protein
MPDPKLLPDKRKKLYDNASKEFNVGTYEEFNKNLDDPAKRKKFYENISTKFNAGSYEEFEANIIPEKKKLPQSLLVDGEDSGSGLQKNTSSGDPKVDFLKQPIQTAVIPTDNLNPIIGLNPNDKAAMDAESVQSEKEQAERDAYLAGQDNGMGRVKSALNDVAQSAMSGLGETAKSVGILAKDLDWFNEYEGKEAKDLSTYKEIGYKILQKNYSLQILNTKMSF